jgi:FtsP/CotA-like multicopper oxidase with cupredoxin domain
MNEFPNNHLFCPHPEAADWPCAIDRTFMGVKATVDPGSAPNGLPYYAVNQFGSPQQPDNSWVTHLHGGEIQPSVDGFAEKWFGNKRTGSVYNATKRDMTPAFEAPYSALKDGSIGLLQRPGGDPATNPLSSWMYDTYTYPMVNDESTIWFHDHTLGKTHHNVIAGPAGFFPVKDPSKHNAQLAGACQVAATPANPFPCEYTWLDPITEPRDALGIPKYDLFLAIQDRAFNDDGTINFPSAMSQPPIPPAAPGAVGYPACLAILGANGLPAPTCSPPGTTALTPGVNPQVHPTWVPEYFADHALVNGVLWPKKTVTGGVYRIRFVDGSDSRCYTLGLGTVEPAYATAAAAAPAPVRNVRFDVIATEQGYLKSPVVGQTSLTMCPGERYEILVNFGGSSIAYKDPVTGATMPAAPLAGKSVFLNNTATAPYPVGISPQQLASPFAQLASIMRFDVSATAKGVPVCPNVGRVQTGTTWPNPADGVGCVNVPPNNDLDFVDIRPFPDCPKDAAGVPNLTFNNGQCIAAERQLYLNEKVDGTTLFSMGLQINGVPFEYKVTETPKAGTYERWKVINATVDAHPVHPHLIKALIVNRQTFNKGAWLKSLCGTTTCAPSEAPGGVQALTPDVTPYLTGTARLPAAYENGWKDAIVAPPAQVTTFVARWDGSWKGAHGECTPAGPADPLCQAPVWEGPYVWHCHINSHEDSEMMRTSLVLQ